MIIISYRTTIYGIAIIVIAIIRILFLFFFGGGGGAMDFLGLPLRFALFELFFLGLMFFLGGGGGPAFPPCSSLTFVCFFFILPPDFGGGGGAPLVFNSDFFCFSFFSEGGGGGLDLSEAVSLFFCFASLSFRWWRRRLLLLLATVGHSQIYLSRRGCRFKSLLLIRCRQQIDSHVLTRVMLINNNNN